MRDAIKLLKLAGHADLGNGPWPRPSPHFVTVETLLTSESRRAATRPPEIDRRRVAFERRKSHGARPSFPRRLSQEIEVGGYWMDGVSPGSSRKTRCTSPSSSSRPTWTKPFATTTFIDATLCSAT